MLDSLARSELKRLQIRLVLAGSVGMGVGAAVDLLLGGGHVGVVFMSPWLVVAILGVPLAYTRGWEAGRRAQGTGTADDTGSRSEDAP